VLAGAHLSEPGVGGRVRGPAPGPGPRSDVRVPPRAIAPPAGAASTTRRDNPRRARVARGPATGEPDDASRSTAAVTLRTPLKCSHRSGAGPPRPRDAGPTAEGVAAVIMQSDQPDPTMRECALELEAHPYRIQQ